MEWVYPAVRCMIESANAAVMTVFRLDPILTGKTMDLTYIRITSLVAIVLLLLQATPDSPTPEPTESPAAIAGPVSAITDDPDACIDGRLRIRDLAHADEHLPDGRAAIQMNAEQWQPDARLVELRLSCPLLKTGLQWEGTFFSETAQANLSTNTGAIEPAEEAPEDIPVLDVSGISFQVVHRSLLRAGFSDELRLAAASSVTVRLSTDQLAFGPPTAPTGALYVHVAVEERGVIKDVWINAEDGTIYRYDLEG